MEPADLSRVTILRGRKKRVRGSLLKTPGRRAEEATAKAALEYKKSLRFMSSQAISLFAFGASVGPLRVFGRIVETQKRLHAEHSGFFIRNVGFHRSMAITSWTATDGTAISSHWPVLLVRGSLPLTRS